MLQTVMQLSCASRTTSYSTSFQPNKDRSTSTYKESGISTVNTNSTVPLTKHANLICQTERARCHVTQMRFIVTDTTAKAAQCKCGPYHYRILDRLCSFDGFIH
jgi:hypothetical protein